MDSGDERMPLNRSGNSETYESIVSKDNAIIYCCHGNAADECCNNIPENNISDQSTDGRLSQFLSDAHCHVGPEEKVDTVARKRLIFASILCLFFMIGEAVGGFLANSLAIATDAAHLLTDFASFMISLLALWVAARPATKRMSFGWYRAEVIGALTSVLLIWVVTGILVYMAVERIRTGEYEIEGEVMLITAAVGVTVNIIMGCSLQIGGVPHGHSHGGGGGHSHGGKHSHDNHSHDSEHGSKNDSDASDKNRGSQNINVRAAFIHVIGDLIQSLGVLTAAFVIYYKPEYAIVDPICTFFFSVLVLISTFTILRDVLNVLMEGMPRGMNFQEVMKLLRTIPGIIKVHNLRIWSLSMDKTALSAHIVIDKGENPILILKQASSIIKQNLGVFELTLQVEEYKEEMQDCSKCKELDY